VVIVVRPHIAEIGILEDSRTVLYLHRELFPQLHTHYLKPSALEPRDDLLDHAVLIGSGLVGGGGEDGKVAFAVTSLALEGEIGHSMLLLHLDLLLAIDLD